MLKKRFSNLVWGIVRPNFKSSVNLVCLSLLYLSPSVCNHKIYVSLLFHLLQIFSEGITYFENLKSPQIRWISLVGICIIWYLDRVALGYRYHARCGGLAPSSASCTSFVYDVGWLSLFNAQWWFWAYVLLET